MMARLIGPLVRRYRAAGHGIHSPFAYWFVTDVLRHRHGYAYYCYDNINSSAATRRQKQFARLVHRIAAALPPEAIVVTTPNPALKVATQRLTRSGATFSMVVVADNTPPSLEQLAGALDRGSIMILSREHRELAAGLRRQMTAGMSFTSGNGNCVIVGNRQLPLTHYSIAF